MTDREIRKLTPRVVDYIERITLFGKHTVTFWYGQIVDTVYVTDDNKEALEELMKDVDRRKGNGNKE